MQAKELMRAADHPTGVHPGMTHDEIRAAQDRATTDVMIVRYFIEEYKKTDDSTLRYEIAERLRAALTRSPHLQTLVSKELPKLIIRAPKRSQRGSAKPRTKGGIKWE